MSIYYRERKRNTLPWFLLFIVLGIFISYWYYTQKISVNQNLLDLVNRAPGEEISANLTFVQGEVYAKNKDSEWQVVDTDFVLSSGQSIKTGDESKAIIELNNGDMIRLAPLTTINFENLKEHEVIINQETGQSYHNLNPEAQTYRVKSLASELTALGTKFNLITNLDENRIKITVIENKVEIKVREGDEIIMNSIIDKDEEVDCYLDKEKNELLQFKNIDYEKLSEESDWYGWNKEQDNNLKNNDIAKTDTEAEEEEYVEDFQLELSGIAQDDGNMIEWSQYPNNDFQFYKIVRSTTSKEISYPENDSIKSYYRDDQLDYLDEEVEENERYYYRVCLKNSKEEIICSNLVTLVSKIKEENDSYTPDNNELDLLANLSGQEVSLNWNKTNDPDFINYRIVRSETNSNPRYPAESYIGVISNKNSLSFVDKNIKSGKKYFYRICYQNSNDIIYCGSVATISTPDEQVADTTPPMSSFLTVNISEAGASLTWTTNTDDDFLEYKVVRSISNPLPSYPSDSNVASKSKGDESYFDSSVKSSSSGIFYYRICSLDKSQNISCSNVKVVENGVIK